MTTEQKVTKPRTKKTDPIPTGWIVSIEHRAEYSSYSQTFSFFHANVDHKGLSRDVWMEIMGAAFIRLTELLPANKASIKRMAITLLVPTYH